MTILLFLLVSFFGLYFFFDYLYYRAMIEFHNMVKCLNCFKTRKYVVPKQGTACPGLWCESCRKSFVVKRCDGSTISLQDQLSAAVEVEDYEMAAMLRDKINAL